MAKHEVTFEGQTFELQSGPMNGLALAQFMDAVSDDDPNAQVAPRIMLKLLKASVAKKDWRRFEDLAYEVDGFWDKAFEAIIVPRMQGPVEAEAGHPTGLPSVSTDGQEATPPKPESNFDARVWELSHGRIDHYHMLMEHRKQAELARSA